MKKVMQEVVFAHFQLTEEKLSDYFQQTNNKLDVITEKLDLSAKNSDNTLKKLDYLIATNSDQKLEKKIDYLIEKLDITPLPIGDLPSSSRLEPVLNTEFCCLCYTQTNKEIFSIKLENNLTPQSNLEEDTMNNLFEEAKCSLQQDEIVTNESNYTDGSSQLGNGVLTAYTKKICINIRCNFQFR